ncbi:MAG: AgmX/PglI C-terminal domain-containing protein [Candidatus Cloacimonetes bacterium]|nr:AgmX/PglI C-terminal domain-containing protein [Candidatus Cloacimonadota bacterium]
MKILCANIVAITLMLVVLSACVSPETYKKGTPAPPKQTETNQVATTPLPTSDIDHVRNVVNARQTQLQNLYKKQSSIKPMQGSLQIKLYIDENGTVQNADIDVDSGALSPEFISSVRNDLSTWRFMIRESLIYTFKINFRRL